jgi:hypothetical protein
VTHPSIRSALAEHLRAYAQVATCASREWTAQIVRRVVAQVIAALFAFVTLLLVLFVAILGTWQTPYRWWVVGGILLLCIGGVLFGLITAQSVRRDGIEPPWTILANEVSNDLHGFRESDDGNSDDARDTGPPYG